MSELKSVDTYEIKWKNQKTLDTAVVQSLTEFLDHNMEGLLPLYLREFKRIKIYSMEHNIDIKVLRSIRNQLRTQQEIIVVRKLHFYEDKVKEKFIGLMEKLADPTTDSKQAVFNFYASLRVPPHSIIKMISDMEQYKALSPDILKYFFSTNQRSRNN